MSKPILYYIYDPMCSWCWGYRDTWLKLSNELEGKASIYYQLGGLAADTTEEMPISLQSTLQNIWQKISEQLGTEFNFDFWSVCSPIRSTYPACRACLIAREHGKEADMLFAIQQAYYLQAMNPSLNSTLLTLSEQIGLEKQEFEEQLTSEAINRSLLKEITFSQQLPIQGFPSLVLSLGGKLTPISINYLDWKKTYSEILDILG